MKTQEEIEQLAEQYINKYTGDHYVYCAYVDAYTQCQEDMADLRFTEKQVLRAIDLAIRVYEKKDGKIFHVAAMSPQDILTTLETEKYTNPEGLPYKE